MSISTHCNVINFALLQDQLEEVSTITYIISNDKGILMDLSNVEEERVTVILPADEEYSTYFELNTTCGIMRNISSNTFSES